MPERPIPTIAEALRSEAGRVAAAAWPDGATLEAKLSFLTSLVDVIIKKHGEEMAVPSWAALHRVKEDLSLAYFEQVRHRSGRCSDASLAGIDAIHSNQNGREYLCPEDDASERPGE